MSWRCSVCGERHDDSFASCWRCSTARAPTSGELAEEAAQTRADALEDAATERELTRQAAILAYEEQAGWVPAHRWVIERSPPARRCTAWRWGIGCTVSARSLEPSAPGPT